MRTKTAADAALATAKQSIASGGLGSRFDGGVHLLTCCAVAAHGKLSLEGEVSLLLGIVVVIVVVLSACRSQPRWMNYYAVLKAVVACR
jgi:hypothetical protein